MSGQTFSTVFDLRTHVDDSLPDVWRELPFAPYKGLQLRMRCNPAPTEEEPQLYICTDVEYMVEEAVFVVSLKAIGPVLIEQEDA